MSRLEEGWMFLEDAALACGVPYERLRKAVQRRGLPAEKLRAGRTTPYVVRLEDVREYLRTVRRGPKKKLGPNPAVEV